MPSIEITAKTLDDAKNQAAAKLGVDAGQLTVTILEESKGLFGKSTVRVRAEYSEAPAAAAKPARAPRGAKAAAPAPAPEPVAEVEEPVKAEKPAGRSRRGKAAEAKPATAEPDVAATSEPAADGGSEVVATQQDADNFLGVLNQLLEKSGLEIEARCLSFSGKYVSIQFDGKDTGYLVGKHGEVLNSFQYLTNIIAAQQWGNGVRAVLDGNDYRSRREEQLTHLATKIAEQVAKRGEEAVLDALPAFERRIVHKAISELSGVTTYSEGEEPNRRVVIAPAD